MILSFYIKLWNLHIFINLIKLSYFTKKYLNCSYINYSRPLYVGSFNHLVKSNMLGYLFDNRLLIFTEDINFNFTTHMLPSERAFDCPKISGQKYLPWLSTPEDNYLSLSLYDCSTKQRDGKRIFFLQLVVSIKTTGSLNYFEIFAPVFTLFM
jgi:hypothetical protein